MTMAVGKPDETPEDYRLWSHQREQEGAEAARRAAPFAQARYDAAVKEHNATLQCLDAATRDALERAKEVGKFRLAKQPVPDSVAKAHDEAEARVRALRSEREATKARVAEAKHELETALLGVHWRERNMKEDEDAMLGITHYAPSPFGRRGRSGVQCAHKHCGRFPDQHTREGFDLVCPAKAPIAGRPYG